MIPVSSICHKRKLKKLFRQHIDLMFISDTRPDTDWIHIADVIRLILHHSSSYIKVIFILAHINLILHGWYIPRVILCVIYGIGMQVPFPEAQMKQSSMSMYIFVIICVITPIASCIQRDAKIKLLWTLN